MQCRVYKITLVAGAGIVGIVKVCQEEICASWAWFWRDLKSFNDSWRVEHARCGFGANNFLVRVWLLWCLLPMRWLFSVRSVSLMERPFPVRPFPVQHTHTHLHLTRTSCSCGTRVSIYVCFSPSDLVTSRLDKKPEVAAGNGKWLQKYCGRQSLQLRIKCSFLSNIRMLFWDLWWQGRAANFVMNKILRRIALDVTGQENNPLELLMTHTQSTWLYRCFSSCVPKHMS